MVVYHQQQPPNREARGPRPFEPQPQDVDPEIRRSCVEEPRSDGRLGLGFTVDHQKLVFVGYR